jgi:ABC-type branched-subunit amino acid transport system substrate-binding protein
MTKLLSSARVWVAVAVLVLAACVPTIQTGRSIDLSEPVPVALLVPGGSGESGDEVLARSLENAARLAIADLGDQVNIDLRVYQTRGNPEMAAFQAATAVNEGARIILGPVFAQSAIAAGAIVREREVNVLSFSNNTDVAGGNVFVLGSTFQNIADRLVGYATAQGHGRIVLAHAETTVGEIGAAAIMRAIDQNGAQLVARNSYPLSQEDVISSVEVIRDTINATGAGALFLTSDTFGELPLLAQILPEAGVDTQETRFIGLTRWDIPSSTLELPGLQGGWFALPDPQLTSAFQARYTQAYNSGPHPIAGLAYDGIAAIGALVAAGKSDALTSTALTQNQGFAGVNGVFRFLPDGTNERALAIDEIRDNQVVVIDPAPRSFGFGGF